MSVSLSAEPFLPVLDLTFTGDLMAHTENSRMDDYTLIYRDIEYITRNDDLTFTNLEVPVVADKPYSSYPYFNIQPEYALTAVDAGFDVFSLVNNHSNDQGADGVASTFDFFTELEDTEAIEAFSGLKPAGTSDITWRLIEKNGFKVLFVAVTELLNTYVNMDRIDYIPPTAKGRAAFKAFCTKLREEHPCDLFVTAIHVDEPEYVRTVPQERKDYFHELLDAGVDIVWASHPHVLQEWEVIDGEDGEPSKLIMYCLGNLISGQRRTRNYEHADGERDWTGDSMLMKVSVVRKDDGSIYFDFVKPLYIATDVDSEGNFVIKRYTEPFIENHSVKDRAYFTKRFDLIQEITGLTICR